MAETWIAETDGAECQPHFSRKRLSFRWPWFHPIILMTLVEKEVTAQACIILGVLHLQQHISVVLWGPSQATPASPNPGSTLSARLTSWKSPSSWAVPGDPSGLRQAQKQVSGKLPGILTCQSLGSTKQQHCFLLVHHHLSFVLGWPAGILLFI
jgi:hypothetical protein